MKIELLIKIKEQILKEPKQFAMRMWFTDYLINHTNGLERTLKTKIPNCGTAACIGGWAMAIHNNQNLKEANYSRGDIRSILGIDYKEYNRLCFFPNWPKKFQKHKNEGTKAFAKQAAARIDHFIATEGRE